MTKEPEENSREIELQTRNQDWIQEIKRGLNMKFENQLGFKSRISKLFVSLLYRLSLNFRSLFLFSQLMRTNKRQSRELQHLKKLKKYQFSLNCKLNKGAKNFPSFLSWGIGIKIIHSNFISTTPTKENHSPAQNSLDQALETWKSGFMNSRIISTTNDGSKSKERMRSGLFFQMKTIKTKNMEKEIKLKKLRRNSIHEDFLVFLFPWNLELRIVIWQ